MSLARAAVLSLLLVPQLAAAQPPGASSTPRIRRAIDSGPLRFEANRGQTDPGVQFFTRGRGYQLFLTGTDAIFQFASTVPDGRNDVLRLQLVGARTPRAITGEERLAAVTNYLKGPQRDWKTGIPNYGRVKYERVYNGVDLEYYGNAQQLEYDFILAPGADPTAIGLRFSGARGLRIADSGELLFRVGARELRQPRPYAFQTIGGVRRQVAAGYVLRRSGDVGFSVGPHDPGVALTIDPVLVYSTYLGGIGEHSGVFAIAADVNGATYVGGGTTPAYVNSIPCTQCDGFVTKFDADGHVVYSTYLGGDGPNEIVDIAVDRWGFAYVTGTTSGTSFPTTEGAFQRECVQSGPRCDDAFVVKLNPSGAIVFSTLFGGIGEATRGTGTHATGIAVDDALNVYIVGHTYRQLPVTPGAFQTAPRGRANTGFVAKLNATGSTVRYATYLGGSVDDGASRVVVDRAGNAYVIGEARSPDFPTTPGAFQRTCRIVSGFDFCSITFVSKLNATGSALLYSTLLGGTGAGIAALDGVSSSPGNIAVDAEGFAYVIGTAYTADFPTTVGSVKPSTTTRDAFAAKLNREGTGLVYSTYLGGDAGDFSVGGGFEEGSDIVVDAGGSAHLVGATGSSDFPRVDPVQPAFGGVVRDAFVATLNPTGSAFTFASYLGGTDSDHGSAIALDPFGNLHVAGDTLSSDFPVVNAAQPSSPGVRPSFVASIGAPASCGADVTAQVQVFQGGFIPVLGPFTLQLAIVWNSSAAPVNGPVAYVMDDLANAVYAGSSAQTRCVSPEGDPLMLVPLGGDNVLAPNEAALMGLWFYQNQLAPISYIPRLLSGYRGG